MNWFFVILAVVAIGEILFTAADDYDWWIGGTLLEWIAFASCVAALCGAYGLALAAALSCDDYPRPLWRKP